jgi:integrase
MRNKALAQLGRILKRARELGMLAPDRDPLLGIKGFSDPDDGNDDASEELGAWTVEEREQLIAAAYAIAPWQGVAVEVAFFTGMRRGETFGLKWSDLDFERREIRVRRSIRPNPIHADSSITRLVNGGSRNMVGDHRLLSDRDFVRIKGGLPMGQVESVPKTASSRSTIEMLPRVRNALQGQRQRNGLTSLWVFPNRNGEPQQVHNFSARLWPAIVERAGVTYRAFKQTRHTFAVLALEAGGEGQLLWVQRMLCHTTSQMLVNHYLKHARPSAPSAEFVARFEAAPIKDDIKSLVAG